MNEKLFDDAARAMLAASNELLGEEYDFDAMDSEDQHLLRVSAQAAIAAHSAFIREAANGSAALNAGRCQLDYHMHTQDDEWLTLQGVFNAMLDQIEGQNDG